MTILDNDGIYGLTSSDPSKHPQGATSTTGFFGATSGAAMLAPKGIVGRTDGVASPAGNTGEQLGSERASTSVGSSYSIRSSTAIGSGSYTQVVSQSLLKGTYIVSVSVGGISTSASSISIYGAINAVQVTTAFLQGNSAANWGLASMSFPVIIKTDNTPVQAYAQFGAGTVSNSQTEMFITRIA